MNDRMAWMLSQDIAYVCALDQVLTEFAWRVYEFVFITREDIGDFKVLSRLWDVYVVQSAMRNSAMLSGKRAVVLASTDAVKSGVKSCTQAAIDYKLFDAPPFTIDDGDMYWGQ
ncbi:hypothetical protein EV183_000171 [Coemansia sp. RSA 2336]|nr:hypothetical protein EV183_000171 [Coemansia sp. RSA 2336]